MVLKDPELRIHSGTRRMAATFPGSTKAISYEGTTIKELDEKKM